MNIERSNEKTHRIKASVKRRQFTVIANTKISGLNVVKVYDKVLAWSLISLYMVCDKVLAWSQLPIYIYKC